MLIQNRISLHYVFIYIKLCKKRKLKRISKIFLLIHFIFGHVAIFLFMPKLLYIGISYRCTSIILSMCIVTKYKNVTIPQDTMIFPLVLSDISNVRYFHFIYTVGRSPSLSHCLLGYC